MGTVDPGTFTWYDIKQAVIFLGYLYLAVLLIVVMTKVFFSAKK